MGRPSKLTPQQEKEALQRLALGESGESVARSLGLHRSNVLRLQQRAQVRALAAAQPAPAAVDPKSGIEVEVTDDLAMGQVVRDLMRVYHRPGTELEDKIAIAHVLPKLATARHRVRQPPPGPKPPDRPQPTEPTKPPEGPGEELVRFN